jgi:hypothetical protein
MTRRTRSRRASPGADNDQPDGPNERDYWTKDAGAGFGHRSATSSRRARGYVGRDLHNGVACPPLLQTNATTWAKFGPAVPVVALFARLVPTNSHPNDAVRDAVFDAHDNELCHDVIIDAGYSLKSRLLIPLQEAGIPATLRPASNQVGEGLGIRGARVFDGQLFSAHIPDDLAALQLPGRNATAQEIEASTEKFQRRATYRYTRHKKPGEDGTTRWSNPFQEGRLRSRSLPRTMRGSRDAPVVELPEGASHAEGTITLGAGELPLMQDTIVGTRAWYEAYERRNVAETFHSFLHGGFVDIDKGFVRIVESAAGIGRIDVLLAHTLAGVNRWQVQNWVCIRRLLDGDNHESSTRKTGQRRKPRSNRLPRFEDLSELARDPPP